MQAGCDTRAIHNAAGGDYGQSGALHQQARERERAKMVVWQLWVKCATVAASLIPWHSTINLRNEWYAAQILLTGVLLHLCYGLLGACFHTV